MTRDEQIAQLKPGDVVGYQKHMTFRPDSIRVHRIVDGGIEAVFAKEEGMTTVYFVPEKYIILPDPPPKPKAVPGVRYQHGSGLSGITRGIGLRDGRIYITSYEQAYDFDPAVWTPIDDVKGE